MALVKIFIFKQERVSSIKNEKAGYLLSQHINGNSIFVSLLELTFRGLLGKLTDNDIIEGIRQRDEKVLNYLYDKWYRLVKTHIIRNSGSEEDVPDVFQDSIIVLYEKICGNHFELTSDLKGYFFGIARNVWNNRLRQKEKEEELDFDVVDEGDENDIADPEYFRIMMRAFDKLRPDCQEVLRMFYDQVPFDEIARKMKFKNETYARRKKYLCKEALMEYIKLDPEFKEYQRFFKK